MREGHLPNLRRHQREPKNEKTLLFWHEEASFIQLSTEYILMIYTKQGSTYLYQKQEHQYKFNRQLYA